MRDTYNATGKEQFNPGEPLTPVDGGITPKQYQFRVGQNIIFNPRVDVQATPFATIRTLADTLDILRSVIEMRKEQVSALTWDIVNASQEDKTEYGEDKKILKSFFESPDRVNDWYDWIGMFLEEVLVVDALTIYRRKTKGGQLYALEIVDGTTIKPLIDQNGRTPLPPYPAYQQILYGYPRGQYTIDEMIYKPKNRRAHTVYGYSPVEYIILTINLALRRQQHFLTYYTDGSMPDGGIYQVPENWTVDQIQQYQEWWNDMLSGNSAERMKMRFVPKGGYQSTKTFEFKFEFDEWLARVICAAFGVNNQVFTKTMNRATAQVQEDMQGDMGLKPLQTFIENTMNVFIKRDFAMPHLKFAFIEEKKDEANIIVQRNVEYVKAGIVSIDEVRQEIGREPIVKDGIPNMIITSAGPIFLTDDFVAGANESTLATMAASAQMTTQMADQSGGGANNGEQQKQTENKKQPDQKTTTTPEKEKTLKSVDDELKRWERFAVNRLKKK